MECVVLKAFPGPRGKSFLPGEIVNTRKWRNTDKLIDQRKMRLATAEELANSVELEDPDAPIKRPSRPSRSEASMPSLKAKKRKH